MTTVEKPFALFYETFPETKLLGAVMYVCMGIIQLFFEQHNIYILKVLVAFHILPVFHLDNFGTLFI